MELREYLFVHDIKVCDFSEKIGYSKAHMSHVLNGHSIPSPRLAKTIFEATNGEVPVDGVCTKKRGSARRNEKKMTESEQLSFIEMFK